MTALVFGPGQSIPTQLGHFCLPMFANFALHQKGKKEMIDPSAKLFLSSVWTEFDEVFSFAQPTQKISFLLHGKCQLTATFELPDSLELSVKMEQFLKRLAVQQLYFI